MIDFWFVDSIGLYILTITLFMSYSFKNRTRVRGREREREETDSMKNIALSAHTAHN